MEPSNTSADAPAHRYQLRQRRALGGSQRLPELRTDSLADTNGGHSDRFASSPTGANNSDDDATIAADGSGPPSTSKSRVLGPGLSPRPDNYSFDNMFRAAKGSDLENMLLFREQPRQIAVLATVVTAVSYFSFTHDSQVRQTEALLLLLARVCMLTMLLLLLASNE